MFVDGCMCVESKLHVTVDMTAEQELGVREVMERECFSLQRCGKEKKGSRQ